jgi:hypothetical protein
MKIRGWLASAVLGVSCASAVRAATLDDVLRPYQIRCDKAEAFSVARNFKHPAQGKMYHTIAAEDPGTKTRIEIEITRPVSAEYALHYSSQQYSVIQGLYGSRTIPYPGAVTVPTGCPENKKPTLTSVEIMGKPVQVLLANASERYVFGVWDDDLIKQKGALAIFYDAKLTTYYQIIIFQPAGAFDREKVFGLLKSLQRAP